MVIEEKRRRTAMGTSSKKENKKKDKKDGGKKNKTLEAPIKQKVSIVQKKKNSVMQELNANTGIPILDHLIS